MCHLVSWKAIPKTDAERMTEQFEVFVDDEASVNDDFKTGLEKAMTRAENLALTGARDVRVWQLVGEAKSRVSVEWSQSNA